MEIDSLSAVFFLSTFMRAKCEITRESDSEVIIGLELCEIYRGSSIKRNHHIVR